MSKSRPILFSPLMVEAILAGRKSMTRRLLDISEPDKYTYSSVLDSKVKAFATFRYKPSPLTFHTVEFPYGRIGDLLWVRESWRISGWDFEESTCTIEYKDGAKKVCELRDWDSKIFNEEWLQSQIVNMANKGILAVVDPENTTTDEVFYEWTGKENSWKPSIHMPHEASRITLEITKIRVERLQDISEEDAMAEGIEPVQGFDSGEGVPQRQMYENYLPYGYTEVLPIASFYSLWDCINGEGAWDLNPFVWVVEFKRKEVGNG